MLANGARMSDGDPAPLPWTQPGSPGPAGVDGPDDNGFQRNKKR